MKDEIYCFKAAAMATIIMHKQKATCMFKVLVKNDTDEEEDIKRVAKRIFSETKEAQVIKYLTYVCLPCYLCYVLCHRNSEVTLKWLF